MPLDCQLVAVWPVTYSDWAAVATIIASAIGVGAAVVALITYRHGVSNAASAHMHELFKSYMLERLACERERCGQASSSMISFRLYALEEMAVWLDAQRKFQWGAPQLDAKSMAAWDGVIDTHLKAQNESQEIQQAILENLRTFPTCYGPEFMTRAAAVLGADELAKWVQAGCPRDKTPNDWLAKDISLPR